MNEGKEKEREEKTEKTRRRRGREGFIKERSEKGGDRKRKKDTDRQTEAERK